MSYFVFYRRLRFRVTVLCLILAAALCVGRNGYAAEKEIPLNFDTQLIRIFEAAQTAPELSPQHPVSSEERKVIAHILGEFRNHQMRLKNAVYRTDTGIIRITWADDDNNDVVKVGYKTRKDPVLGNSVYADKRQVYDVKISYRAGNAYDYLLFMNMDIALMSNAADGDRPQPLPEKPTFDHYRVEGKLTNEECRFCHILAQNDGSPKGVFFPRYQESYGEHTMGELNPLFRTDHFARMPASSAGNLGLPEMKEDFLYQKISASPKMPPENMPFVRTLIELPQLIEVMARDNKQSTCVAVDIRFNDRRLGGDGSNDYVCADNAAQRLMVKLTNPVLTSNKGAKEYSEPYFEKK